EQHLARAREHPRVAGEPAHRVEAGGKRHHVVDGHGAVSGPEAEYAAVARGHADGAARVGAEGEVDESRRDGGDRSAGRAAAPAEAVRGDEAAGRRWGRRGLTGVPWWMLMPSRLKAGSSVHDLPTRVAPASRSRRTAGAVSVGIGWVRSQSGLPAPVG